MFQKLDSREVTREVYGALCIMPGITKEGTPENGCRTVQVGSTGYSLDQLVEGNVIDEACKHALRVKGDIEIAPHLKERRLVIVIKVTDDRSNVTYFLVYSGDVISKAPDFAVFRPKLSHSEHKPYHHNRIRQERGFLSRRR